MPRNFTNWFEGYAGLTKVSEAPESFHFWTAVSTIAGALRRHVWIDELSFTWTPNFYIILVAPPGVVSKSTSLNIGMTLLKGVKGVVFGPQSGTWQYLIRALKESSQDFVWRRSDGTDSKYTMSPITCASSELGSFLKTDDDGLLSFLIDIWDGRTGDWAHGTITSGEQKAENPWINLIAATTPSWLQAHFPPEMIGGGLTSRMIFVYADKKQRLIAYPSDEVQSADYKIVERALFLDLCEISTIVGEYRLTPDAKAFGRQWYEQHWLGNRPEHLNSERFEGYIARKQTHIHKLAMVLSAAKHSRLEIDLDTMIEAEQRITGVEVGMSHAFTSIGLPSEARQIAELSMLLRGHGGMLSIKELRRLSVQLMSTLDFKAAVNGGVDGSLFTTCKVDGSPGVRLMR